jgi:DNA repair photolyase
MKALNYISQEEKKLLNPLLLNVVAYRKSGLSLNHIIGCSLDCAYCVRHFFDNFEMKEPRMLCSDVEAVHQLVHHPFFIPNVTPIQIFNRATDPFLAGVKKHTHEVLKLIDSRGLKNHVLIITRAKVSKEDIEQLEDLENIKVSLLLTYSGIIDPRIEPIAKHGTTVKSIETIAKYKKKIKLILYWRPLVVGWNDDSESFNRVLNVAQYADAIVYTGYYHRPENFAYLKSRGLNVSYGDFARRKFLPKELEGRIFEAYNRSGLQVPLFRKTSCGVAYANRLPDYNGHWGVNELCDICPQAQKELCTREYKAPTRQAFQSLLDSYGYKTMFLIEDGHIWTEALGEEKRYHLQHSLGYQVWDIEKPHFKDQHGRSPFGHIPDENNLAWHEKVKEQFYNDIIETDD